MEKSRKPVVVVLVVSVVCVLAGAVGLIGAFRSLTGEVFTTPVAVELSLEPGGQRVWESTGTTQRVGGVTVSRVRGTRVSYRDVTVRGPSGDSLDVGAPPLSETLTFGGDTFFSVAAFTATEAGVHTISIDSAEPARVMISKSFGAVLSGVALVFVALSVLGVVATLGSIIALALMSSRRRSTPRPSSSHVESADNSVQPPPPQPNPVA